MEDNEIYINTYDEQAIGAISYGHIYPHGDETRPFTISTKIIRVATKEEYLEWIEEQGLLHMVNRPNLDDPNLIFYLIQVLD